MAPGAVARRKCPDLETYGSSIRNDSKRPKNEQSPIALRGLKILSDPGWPWSGTAGRACFAVQFLSPGRFFLFKKADLWFEYRSAQSCGSVTAHCRLAKHSAAHSSVHETARHVHDHSKLRHKVGRDSGGQHGAPAIERTRARPDGGATMLNAQLVHPGLRPPSISPAIA